MFRHQMTIKADASTDDTVDPDYSTVMMAKIPCNIIPKGGGEKHRGKQLEATTQAVIECRYIAGLKPNMIAVNDYTGETWFISNLRDLDGEQREWMIQATKLEV